MSEQDSGGGPSGRTTFASLQAVLRDYPDADTSALWVPADEALALFERARSAEAIAYDQNSHPDPPTSWRLRAEEVQAECYDERRQRKAWFKTAGEKHRAMRAAETRAEIAETAFAELRDAARAAEVDVVEMLYGSGHGTPDASLARLRGVLVATPSDLAARRDRRSEAKTLRSEVPRIIEAVRAGIAAAGEWDPAIDEAAVRSRLNDLADKIERGDG